MQVYHGIEIRFLNSSSDLFFESLETQMPDEWSRDRKSEEKASSEFTDRAFCFEHHEYGQLPHAMAFFFCGEDESVALGNIVPLDIGEMSYEQYNALVKALFQVIEKCTSNFPGVQCTLTPSSVSASDLMSAHTAKLLRQFSVLANKSTGSSHPSDEKRWNAFLIAAHAEQSPPCASDICQLLEEDLGWHEDQAHRLAIQYEQGIALLAQYDSELAMA